MKRHFFKFLLATVKALVIIKRLIVWLAQTIARFFAWLLRPVIPFVVAPLYQIFRRHWRHYLDISENPWERRRVVLSSRPSIIMGVTVLILLVTHGSVRASEQPGVISGSRSIILTHLVTGGESEWLPQDGSGDSGAIAEQVPTTMYRNGGSVAYVFPLTGAVGRAPVSGEEAPRPAETKPTTPIQKYAVQRGDTLAKIARVFGIKVDTLLWANGLNKNSVLRQGDTLTVPSVDGVIYTVKSGGTLSDVAKIYKVTAKSIATANNIATVAKLQKGQVLIVPGARPLTTPKPPPTTVARVEQPTETAPSISNEIDVEPDQAPDPTPTVEVIKRPPLAAGEKMLWPTRRRAITQYYSARHGGLDIDGDYTDPVYAIDNGTVTFSGWNNSGYGNMVLIDHGNGIASRYAHNSKVYVRVGQQVNRGDIIGMVGTTGRSTGTHLHFEVIVKGRRVNPFSYVR